ncbi:MAG: hypothetical protein GY710_15255 [Desulfobacteraceae bacterium]|nr:hypothetical protein [Desulfobacteraceae bacterium]
MEKYLLKKSQTLIILFPVILLFFLIGCLGSSGKLKFNSALLDQYRAKVLSKTYNYYYCGRSTIPYAVVGIDDTYEFSTRFWFKIESEQAVYKKIANLSDFEPNSGPLVGSDILDENGNKIGVWFSHYRYTVVRVIPESRRVEVFNPYKPNAMDRMGL